VSSNDTLRQIRLSQPSRVRPSQPMSRRELAELVNQYVWDNFQQRTGLDENYIGKLERGVVRWPNDVYRAGLRAVLGVGDDADLGFRPTRGPLSPGPGDESPAWITSMAVAAASVLDAMTLSTPPSRVGRPEIDQIREAAQAFAAWDNRYGGLARDAPIALLRWSAGLLRSRTCPVPLQPELLSAVAHLAHTCGFMAFDSHAFDDARRLLAFGVACAEEADNWQLRARLLATTARVDTWVGEPDRGLTHTQLALVRSDRLTATEQAMLHSLEARALARMGRAEETNDAIARADAAFAHRQVDEDPTWMAHYDAAQHAGDTGAALADLVLATRAGTETATELPPLPDPVIDDARRRLQDAVDLRRPELVRCRALSEIGLAKLMMATGDLDEAIALAERALATAESMRSRRVADELIRLDRLAERHEDHAGVQALRARLSVAAMP
jgi:tetratricopeptide (TPR) repeat protein